MAHSFTMGTLLTRARARADKAGDEALADSDLQVLISEVYGKLYCLVSETGHRYFEKVDTVSTTGADSYTIPTDHLGTVRVERVMDTAGRAMPLREISAQEQTYWRGLTGSARVYSIVADQLFLHPTPPTGDTYNVRYIPQPPDLSTLLSSDSVDLVVPAGEQFLLWGVAVVAKGQSDGDVRLAIQEREAAEQRVLEWAQLRAFSQAPSPFVDDYETIGMTPNSYDYGTGWWNRPR